MAKTQAMKFEYSGAPQRSPEWFKIRLGKVTASRLVDWLAVSKAKTGAGKPLKARLDYEKELMFERQFGVSYDNYVTSAMQEGTDYEDFARRQYQEATGNLVDECGCWYNEQFVASPDGVIQGPAGEIVGLLEIKVLRDNSFTDVLMNGVPDKHWKQIQGQLWASKAKWCDYVAMNLNTKKFVIVRVQPDEEFFEWLELTLSEKLVTDEFALTNVHDIVGEIPEGGPQPSLAIGDITKLSGGW